MTVALINVIGLTFVLLRYPMAYIEIALLLCCSLHTLHQ